jgi:hypothetical protein
MGFFSGITSLLGGGSSSKGSSSSGGFNDLPVSIKGAYKDFGQQIRDLIATGNLSNMYTPLAQTAGETKAYNAINTGFTPTDQTIQSDIGMQTNPYDKYVIDEINRQAGGDYSILKQALNESGQFGSNRQNLGANDIDLSRLNQIGSFKRDAYNTALNNALTTLPGLRQQDAQGQLVAGGLQRDLYGQTQTAPVTALQELAKALGILPTTAGGGTSSEKSTKSGEGGIGSIIGAIGGLFSDEDLKENIEYVGEENGHGLYEFNYIDDPVRYVGVLAQEVEQTNPEAVFIDDLGYKRVNYDAIGVEFRRADGVS